MTSIAYILALFLLGVVVISWFLYLGKPTRHNMTSPMGAFFLMWTCLIQIPGLIIFPFRYMGRPHADDYILAIPICSLVVLLFGSIFAGFGRGRWQRWWQEPTHVMHTERIVKNVLWVIGILIAIASIIASKGDIPLLRAIRQPGQAAQWFAMRWEFGYEMGLLGYLIYHSERLILPTALAASLVFALLQRRGKLRIFVLFCLVFLVTSFSLHKIRPMRITLVFFLAYMLFRNRRFRIVYLLPAAFVVMLFPVFVEMFSYSSSFEWGQIPAIYGRLFNRVFGAPSHCIAGHFMFVPAQSGRFLHGQTIGLIAKLMGEPHYPVAFYVAYYIGEATKLGSSMANAAYVATAWADFGWIGIVTYSSLLGIWIGLADKMIRQCVKTPITIALAACTTVQVLSLAGDPLHVWLLSFGGFANLAFLYLARNHTRSQPLTMVHEGYGTEYPAQCDNKSPREWNSPDLRIE